MVVWNAREESKATEKHDHIMLDHFCSTTHQVQQPPSFQKWLVTNVLPHTPPHCRMYFPGSRTWATAFDQLKIKVEPITNRIIFILGKLSLSAAVTPLHLRVLLPEAAEVKGEVISQTERTSIAQDSPVYWMQMLKINLHHPLPTECPRDRWEGSIPEGNYLDSRN